MGITGSKMDLEESRSVTFIELEKAIKEEEGIGLETSSKSNIGVTELFQ